MAVETSAMIATMTRTATAKDPAPGRRRPIVLGLSGKMRRTTTVRAVDTTVRVSRTSRTASSPSGHRG